MKRTHGTSKLFVAGLACPLARSGRLAGRSGHDERHARESDHFRRPDAAVHSEWRRHIGADRCFSRRRIHVCAPSQRDGAVHGTEPVRTAWRRELGGFLGARPGQRHHHGDACHRGRRVRVRAACERHREVLGAGRIRAARRRELRNLRAHSRVGEQPHRRRRPRGRVWTRVCAPRRRHDAVLGREPRRAARERDHRQSRALPSR